VNLPAEPNKHPIVRERGKDPSVAVRDGKIIAHAEI
jgi:hypothetical protein